MKINQWRTIPNNRRGSIINGIKLEPIKTEHADGGCRFYTSREALVHRLHAHLAKIVTLTQDVFATPLDLALLDRSHNVLGEGSNETFHRGIEGVFAAEQEIDHILKALTPRLPFYRAGDHVAYFLPALTMPIGRRVEFAQLSDSEMLLTALEAKRVFVNGAKFYGYGIGGKSIPDDSFWHCLFGKSCDDIDPPLASASGVEAAKITEFCPGAIAFWLERCVHRDVGHTLLMDQLDLDELCTGGDKKLVESLRAIKSELGWSLPSNLHAIEYFGAATKSRS